MKCTMIVDKNLQKTKTHRYTMSHCTVKGIAWCVYCGELY